MKYILTLVTVFFLASCQKDTTCKPKSYHDTWRDDSGRMEGGIAISLYDVFWFDEPFLFDENTKKLPIGNDNIESYLRENGIASDTYSIQDMESRREISGTFSLDFNNGRSLYFSGYKLNQTDYVQYNFKANQQDGLYQPFDISIMNAISSFVGNQQEREKLIHQLFALQQQKIDNQDFNQEYCHLGILYSSSVHTKDYILKIRTVEYTNKQYENYIFIHRFEG